MKLITYRITVAANDTVTKQEAKKMMELALSRYPFDYKDANPYVFVMQMDENIGDRK